MGFWNRRGRGEHASTDGPGCFERHLQRRRQNPLFPTDRQDVGPIEIDQARLRDNAERSTLKSRILETLHPLMEGPDSVDGQTAIDLLQKLHHLVERVYQSDQGLEQEAAALQRGYQTLSESIRSVRGPEYSAQLDSAARALQAQVTLFSAPLLATLSRTDSPMRQDELVPSILGLSVSDMQRCLDGIRTLPDESLPVTVSQAIQLIERAAENGIRIADVSEKVRLLQEVRQDAG